MSGDGLFDVSGRVVVVTGARGGIGGAVARGLQSRGATVIGVDVEAFDAGSLTEALVLDVTDAPAVERFSLRLGKTYGRVDGLVNVAGIGGSHPAETFPLDRWQQVLNTNLTGSFRMARSLAPLFGAGSSIVNVASTYALRAPYVLPSSAYAAAKAGITGLTRALASEWGPRGIRVTAIAPGHILTAMTQDRLQRPDYLEPVLARTPLRRIGEPEDLVGPVVFLLSPASNFVTGEVLVVDGGWIIA